MRVRGPPSGREVPRGEQGPDKNELDVASRRTRGVWGDGGGGTQAFGVAVCLPELPAAGGAGAGKSKALERCLLEEKGLRGLGTIAKPTPTMHKQWTPVQPFLESQIRAISAPQARRRRWGVEEDPMKNG